MTPGEFQTVALAWIAAVSAVLVAVIGAVFGLWALLKSKAAEVMTKEANARLNRHSEALRAQDARLTGALVEQERKR